MYKIRKLHRATVWWASAFLITAAVTGLLWAYAPYLYWNTGYKQRKHQADVQYLSATQLSLSDVLHRLAQRFGRNVTPLEITLTTDAGLLLYRIRFVGKEDKPQYALIDALSGNWISPLKRDDAIKFARQYVMNSPSVVAAVFLKTWVPRKHTIGKPVWRITFSDSGETQIFIDPDTGEILEDQDRVRRFHFFIMKLHQLNFFGFHKTLTIIPGLFLLLMLGTGVYIRIAPRLRR